MWAAQAVTIINKATAREQSSLVSCTPQAGQGKHTTSLHFRRGHAHSTSARTWTHAKPARAKPLSRRLHRASPQKAKRLVLKGTAPLPQDALHPAGTCPSELITYVSGMPGTVTGVGFQGMCVPYPCPGCTVVEHPQTGISDMGTGRGITPSARPAHEETHPVAVLSAQKP